MAVVVWCYHQQPTQRWQAQGQPQGIAPTIPGCGKLCDGRSPIGPVFWKNRPNWASTDYGM